MKTYGNVSNYYTIANVTNINDNLKFILNCHIENIYIYIYNPRPDIKNFTSKK